MERAVLIVRSTSVFEKSFRRLPSNIQALAGQQAVVGLPIAQAAEQKDKIFRRNAFDPRLHTHKLKGELEGYRAYSVNYQYRVLFSFLNHNEVVYYDIGTHEIYR